MTRFFAATTTVLVALTLYQWVALAAVTVRVA